MPVGFSAIAYSDVSLELSWGQVRVPFPINIVGYEVFRNGELLAYTDNGSSYIDSTVQPGIDYRYSISAVDGQARSSDMSAEVNN